MIEPAIELPGLGRAVACAIATNTPHRPTPLRFVWHHIQPQEAGGATVTENLVSLCDSCHYSIHRILWTLKQGTPLPKHLNSTQVGYAQAGYSRCVAAGTVAQIPNEG